MTPEETVILARYVRAAFPHQKFDEYTPDAWHDILGDYLLADAREAAARVARRQPFVAPSEIIAEIGKIRGERTHDFVYEPPASDSDPDYLKRYRAQLTATGSGQRPPVVRKELAARPVDKFLEQVGRAIPSAEDDAVTAIRRRGPLSVECPTCQAPIGRACRTPELAGRPRRERRDPHDARQATARGQTPSDPHAEEQRRRDAAARLATRQET